MSEDEDNVFGEFSAYAREDGSVDLYTDEYKHPLTNTEARGLAKWILENTKEQP